MRRAESYGSLHHRRNED